MLQAAPQHNAFEKNVLLEKPGATKRTFSQTRYELELAVPAEEQKQIDARWGVVMAEREERKKQRAIATKSFPTLQSYFQFLCHETPVEPVVGPADAPLTLAYCFEQLNLTQISAATSLMRFFMSLRATADELLQFGLLDFDEQRTRKPCLQCICCKETTPYAKGLCKTHYERYKYLRRKLKTERDQV